MNNIFVPNNYIKLSSIKISNDIDKAFKENNGFEVKLEFNDLPYGENSLSKSIDEETMTLHHDKHHKKYFDNLMEALSEENIENLNVNDILSNLEKYPKLETMVVVISIMSFFGILCHQNQKQNQKKNC